MKDSIFWFGAKEIIEKGKISSIGYGYVLNFGKRPKKLMYNYSNIECFGNALAKDLFRGGKFFIRYFGEGSSVEVRDLASRSRLEYLRNITDGELEAVLKVASNSLKDKSYSGNASLVNYTPEEASTNLD